MKTAVEEVEEILHRKRALNVEIKFLESEARITFSRTIEQIPLTIKGMNLLAELSNEFSYDFIQERMFEIIEDVLDTVPEDIEGIKMLLNWWHSFFSTGSQGKGKIEAKINAILPKILETMPYAQSNIDLLGQLEVIFPKYTGEIWWNLTEKRVEIRRHLKANCQ